MCYYYVASLLLHMALHLTFILLLLYAAMVVVVGKWDAREAGKVVCMLLQGSLIPHLIIIFF